MNQQLYLGTVVFLFLFVGLEVVVVAFQSKQQIYVPRHQTNRINQSGRESQTELYGLFGRLRKDRKIEQVATIKVGDTLPSGVEIERLLPVTDDTKDGEQLSEPISIQDALGPNKALLVGRFFVKMFTNPEILFKTSTQKICFYDRYAGCIYDNMFANTLTWLCPIC
jgi:hypothetical protein